MFIYCISSGEMTELKGGVTSTVAFGYSGLDAGKNNTRMIQVKGVGPIPPGHYTIGPARTSQQTGPMVMDLTPKEGTETYGRGSFECHGESRENPGRASHGCIIMPPYARGRIDASPDRELLVIL